MKITHFPECRGAFFHQRLELGSQKTICSYNHHLLQMDVSKNSGTPKSSILIEFSIINHPFWGTTILGNPHVLPPSFFNHLFALACSPKNGQKLNFKSSPSPSTTFTGLNLNDLDDQVQVRLVKGILETKHVSATRNRNRFLKDSIEILVVKNRDS